MSATDARARARRMHYAHCTDTYSPRSAYNIDKRRRCGNLLLSDISMLGSETPLCPVAILIENEKRKKKWNQNYPPNLVVDFETFSCIATDTLGWYFLWIHTSWYKCIITRVLEFSLWINCKTEFIMYYSQGTSILRLVFWSIDHATAARTMFI